MRSTTIFALIGAYATVAAVASPLARVDGPVKQINADCNGPIVNLFAFTGQDCKNDGTTSAGFSPFAYQFKFSAVPEDNGSYESGCQQIRIPDGNAVSVVYTSDGAYQEECSLEFYNANNCKGSYVNSVDLDDDVSSCINQGARFAKLVCAQQ